MDGSALLGKALNPFFRDGGIDLATALSFVFPLLPHLKAVLEVFRVPPLLIVEVSAAPAQFWGVLFRVAIFSAPPSSVVHRLGRSLLPCCVPGLTFLAASHVVSAASSVCCLSGFLCFLKLIRVWMFFWRLCLTFLSVLSLF